MQKQLKKLACAIFYFSTKWQSLKNYEKKLISSKNLFSFWKEIFVFPFSSIFLPVGHCSKGWSKVNLKVYDVIICLNKNLTLSIDKS